jgi:Domain of unknown function (DUF4136)
VELGKRTVSAGIMAAVLMGGLVLAGCDDSSVEVLRDPDVHVAKGMTWAWRPVTAPPANTNRDADSRPVVSRDVIANAPAPDQHLESNRDWNTEANRQRLKEAVERALRSKGLVETPDAAKADFLVDYHVAVKAQREVVGTAYPGWGWWGWGWGPPEAYYQPVNVQEGTFVLDMSLQNPKKLAFRAIGHRFLGYGYKRTITPYQAEAAVNHLLKGLKVR